MTNIPLTAVLQDHDLTVEMPTAATTSVTVLFSDDTRITRNGDFRITRNGDFRVARHPAVVYPVVLTAVLQDHDLTVEMPTAATTSVTVLFSDDTRITRNGDFRITRNGDFRVARHPAVVYPVVLTAVLQDHDLTVEIL